MVSIIDRIIIMNVAFDPWVPVVMLDGKPKMVSLHDAFVYGHLISDLSVRPPERVALMRLLICISHAALRGPKDYDAWLELKKSSNILADATSFYLDAWRDSFELFHDTKPWLQIAGLKPVNNDSWTAVSKLFFYMATGNNSTLFDHDGTNKNRKISLEDIALGLLTFQCFSPAGTLSSVIWGNSKIDHIGGNDAPCCPDSMLHAFIRRSNLIDTIISNIPSFDDVNDSYGPNNLGKPIWEMVPKSLTDSLAETNATKTYIGRLVPLSRLLLLKEDGQFLLYAKSFVYPGFLWSNKWKKVHSFFTQEPSATIIENKKEKYLLGSKPGKAIWRELAAILVKRSKTNNNLGGPLSLLSLSNDEDCDIIICALVRDLASIEDTIESVYHIPSKLRSDKGQNTYQLEVKFSKDLSEKLGFAIEEYRKNVCKGSSFDYREKLNGLVQYWTLVEENLHILINYINAIGTDNAIPMQEEWQKFLKKSVKDSYDFVCSRKTPRQIKAYFSGLKKLSL
jgi:CRISPR system Cascade subunit CasA